MGVSKEHASASLLWLMMAGCMPTIPEFKGTLRAGQELVTLATRQGVTVRVLLMTPNTDPKAILVYFPGGGGTLVGPDGRLRHGRFVSVFAEQPFITAVVDRPSDRAGGVSGTDPFRASNAHTEDINNIIEFLRRKWTKPVFLVGHSGGSTSVAHLGAASKDQRIAGVVLMAAISAHERAGVSLSNLPLHEITHPTLFVHHREDRCASFEGVRQQQSRLTGSPRVDLVEVLGGDRSRTLQCSPFARQDRVDYAHFFSGKEREVFQTITAWVSGKPIPERIGP